jgi:transcriptional regulator with XRE-family HTH domain
MSELKRLRKKRGLKAIDLCCVVKIHPVTICAVENRRQVPGRETRAKLCEFFGVKEADLFDSNGLAV